MPRDLVRWKEAKARWYRAHKELTAARTKAWRLANPDRRREYARKHARIKYRQKKHDERLAQCGMVVVPFHQ